VNHLSLKPYFTGNDLHQTSDLWRHCQQTQYYCCAAALLIKGFLLLKAGYPMTGAHFNEIRFVNTAHRFYRGASGVKPTPRRRINSFKSMTAINKPNIMLSQQVSRQIGFIVGTAVIYNNRFLHNRFLIDFYLDQQSIIYYRYCYRY